MQQSSQQSSGRQAAKDLPLEFWYALPARTDQIREQAESQLPPTEVPAFRWEIQRRAVLAIIVLIFIAIWCFTFSAVLFDASPTKHRTPSQQQQSPASTEPNLKPIPF